MRGCLHSESLFIHFYCYDYSFFLPLTFYRSAKLKCHASRNEFAPKAASPDRRGYGRSTTLCPDDDDFTVGA
jgi:hypothetical protein